ncbi:MAG: hypothetical protein ACRDN0_06830 [Trebonia sp.]
MSQSVESLSWSGAPFAWITAAQCAKSKPRNCRSSHSPSSSMPVERAQVSACCRAAPR